MERAKVNWDNASADMGQENWVKPVDLEKPKRFIFIEMLAAKESGYKDRKNNPVKVTPFVLVEELTGRKAVLEANAKAFTAMRLADPAYGDVVELESHLEDVMNDQLGEVAIADDGKPMQRRVFNFSVVGQADDKKLEKVKENAGLKNEKQTTEEEINIDDIPF